MIYIHFNTRTAFLQSNGHHMY